MRKTKKNKPEAIKNERNRKKDHTENDFTGCDKLIANIGGRRIMLDKEQQRELLEFIYAIGSC